MTIDINASYVGGFIAYSPVQANFTSCYLYGTVRSTLYLGGFIAYAPATIYFTSCYSSGYVYDYNIASGYSGTFIGYAEGSGIFTTSSSESC